MPEVVSEEQYRKLKRDVDSTRSEAQRAKGAYEQLMTQLKNEFGCKTLKEAKALLEDMEAKKEKAEKEFEKAMREYEKKWKQDDS